MSKERLDLLLEALSDADSVLILPHNDPDPDAIASAVALRHLLAARLSLPAQIVYKGIIGRAENKALVRYLGHPLRRVKGSDWHQSASVALVDSQPGAGNNALPSPFTPAVVLDHHPWRQATDGAAFADVRPDFGATSTMLTEYLQAAGVDLAPKLATALFYGIKTDTMGLVRSASPADVAAYFFLQPRIEVDALVEIERAQVPAEYFGRLHAALQGARIYDNVIISYLGSMSRPDMVAEMADLFLRLQGTQWVICLGTYKEAMVLAVRTRSRRGGAGQLAQAVVGARGTAGGHGVMAGGHIPLQGADPDEVARQLRRRALEHLRVPSETAGRPLI